MNNPIKIALKLNEGDEYEYLDVDNPYKTHCDSSEGGTSTVGKVEGDSSGTKSPIEPTTVRNQYWMDQALGGSRGFNYSMMTTKGRLGESVNVMNLLTERDVIVVPSQEPPMEEDPNMAMDPGMEGGEEMPMEDPNMGMEEDPNMAMDPGMEGGEEDPNISALMGILQSADPETIEAVKKYAEGVLKAKGGDEGMDDMGGMEEDPNMAMDPGMEGGEIPMEEDPNAAPPPQTESRKINLDEMISDYLNDTKKQSVPTVSHDIGSGGGKSLKSKMFNPLQS